MKTIDEMARDAGGYFAELPKGDAWLFDNEEQLERFAALVAAEEREACARMVEDKFDFVGDELIIADAIRARGQA
jgi:hypothetical protein